MWQVQNVSPDTVSVTDLPIPITWAPQQIQPVPVASWGFSPQLSAALAAGQLCVVAYQDAGPAPRWGPLTLTVIGTQTATGLQPATVTGNGSSPYWTTGPFARGQIFARVVAAASGSSFTLRAAPWDGLPAAASGYAAETLWGPITSPQVGPPDLWWTPPLLAAQFQWTATGSASVTVVVQLAP